MATASKLPSLGGKAFIVPCKKPDAGMEWLRMAGADGEVQRSLQPE